MFAELDKIALTTAIPLESIFDVPSQSLIWDSPNGEGLIPGDVGIVVDVQGGGERLRRGPGEHADVLGAPCHRAGSSEHAVSWDEVHFLP